MDAPTPAWTPPQTSSRRSVSFANSLNHESYALQDFRLGGSVPSSVFSSTQSSPSSQSSSPTLTTSPLLEEEELVRRVKNGRHASASSTFTALSATTTTFTTDGLLSLPPPKPYDVVIDNLTIGVPVSKRSTLRDRLSELAGRATGRGKYGELGKSRQHVESVAGGAKEEAIVRSAGGRCNAGEVLALMGGSGSGKTTLLNAIANRLGDLPVLSGKVSFEESTGDTSASSSPLSPSSRASKKKLRKKVKTQRKMVGKVMGFVQQSDDHLLPYLTCRETLAFAADLRLPRSTTKEERRSIVEQTLAELGLTDVAETMVGGALRKGISGGQRRRLSIGCVLVTLPSVLLLDEPTTGLDATSGIALLQTLSQLARRNRTIILSVHSPRSEAFILFDRIILLSRGDVAYSGKSSNMIGWFERFSGRRLPQGVNPLDFVVDCTSVDYRDPKSEASSRARVTSLLAHWKSSPVEDDPFTPLSTNRRSQARMSTYTLSQSTDDSANETYDKRRPSQLAQTAILLRRSHLNVYRDVPQLAGLLGQAIVLGLFLGFNMFQIGESPADVQTVKNATYTQITQYLYLSAVFWVWKATTSLRVFDRERADRLYGVAPYVLSDFVSFLVPSVISSILFSVLLFCLAGLRRDTYVSSLVTFAGTCVLSQFVLQGLALVSAALFRDFAMASLFSNAISMFRALSSGFLVVHVPAYLKWIKWTSQTYFGFRILAGSLLKDRSFDCPGVEGDALAQCDGNKVLVGMDLRSDGPSSGIWFAALAALFVVQYALAIVILQFYHPGRQKAAGAVKPKKPSTSKSTVSMPVAREEITIELKDLNLQWTKRAIGPLSKGASKTILDRVSCTFTPGDVNVIMGPSGSGKSTIEQILSHRQLRAGPLASFAMEGSLTFNGHPAGKKTQHLVGFVGQEDGHHFPGLSVRETVLFAAHLKLRHLSKRERVARAEEVLSILGLSLCADNLVGGPLLKGISGGEKRRLSIAVVLLSDPSVMILDEPTSGLDSFTAASVMEVLKDIAQSGRMVIASIHQPRTEVFEKFDNLCTLAKGGRVVYAGPADKATSWFVEEQGCLPAFDVNPADWLLDLISEDSDKDAFFESTSRVAALVDAWNSRTSDKNSYGLAPSLLTAGPLPDPPKTSKGPSLVLVPVLVRRMIKNLVRSRAILHRPLQAPFISLLLLLFFQKLSDGASGAQDRIGWAIQCVSTTPFLGLVVGVATFSIDRDLFYHEYEGSKAYSATTFLLSYTAVETPMTALAALLFGCIMNLAIGAETSVSIFFQFVTAIFSCLSFGESVAVISSTLVRDMGVATTTVPTLLAMAVQLSGLLSLSTPGALEIISWATPLRVATKVIFINELNNGLVFDCSPESVASGECVSKTGSALLSRFELHDLNTTKFCFVSLATVLGWRLLAFVLLEIRMRLR